MKKKKRKLRNELETARGFLSVCVCLPPRIGKFLCPFENHTRSVPDGEVNLTSPPSASLSYFFSLSLRPPPLCVGVVFLWKQKVDIQQKCIFHGGWHLNPGPNAFTTSEPRLCPRLLSRLPRCGRIGRCSRETSLLPNDVFLEQAQWKTLPGFLLLWA